MNCDQLTPADECLDVEWQDMYQRAVVPNPHVPQTEPSRAAASIIHYQLWWFILVADPICELLILMYSDSGMWRKRKWMWKWASRNSRSRKPANLLGKRELWHLTRVKINRYNKVGLGLRGPFKSDWLKNNTFSPQISSVHTLPPGVAAHGACPQANHVPAPCG